MLTKVEENRQYFNIYNHILENINQNKLQWEVEFVTDYQSVPQARLRVMFLLPQIRCI